MPTSVGVQAVPVSRWASEAAAISKGEFARRHPGPVLVIEPLSAGSDPRDEGRRRSDLHASARVLCLTDSGTIRIGRDSECELRLPHSRLSSLHATLRRIAGAWSATSSGADGSATLNGRRLRNEPLASGDRLAIGDVVEIRYLGGAALLHDDLVRLARRARAPRSSRLGGSSSTALDAFLQAFGHLDRRAFLERFAGSRFVFTAASFERPTRDAVAVHVLEPGPSGGALSIGRRRSSDLVVKHRSVSLRHAELVTHDGMWFVQDSGSARGTRVSGRRVEAGAPIAIEGATAELEVGDVALRVATPAAFFDVLDWLKALPSAATPACDAGEIAALAHLVAAQAGVPRLLRPVPRLPRIPAGRARIAAALLASVVLAGSAPRLGSRGFLIYLFGERHPEWFERRDGADGRRS